MQGTNRGAVSDLGRSRQRRALRRAAVGVGACGERGHRRTHRRGGEPAGNPVRVPAHHHGFAVVPTHLRGASLMPTTNSSKLKEITFTLGGNDFKCQLESWNVANNSEDGERFY